MNTPQTIPSYACPIISFDVIGIDAATFLHSQLTQDVLHWQPNEIKRAAWCNPKGRILATFYIWQIQTGFRLVVAKDLANKVIARLRLFILRAKVTISEPLPIEYVLVPSQYSTLSHTDVYWVVLPNLALTIINYININSNDINNNNNVNNLHWDLAHIQAGVAWVNADNTEQFIPQTINFELVAGINFKKGCYPGQEIVARSQYLGKLKQRASIGIFEIPDLYPIDYSTDALNDIFEHNPIATTDILKPSIAIGRIILAYQNWILFDAPISLLANNTCFYIKNQQGSVLDVLKVIVQPLPYSIIDITA